jgi:hypothetical protein
MLRKHLLALSLALPLIGASGIAFAGSTISDKNYWPDQARRGGYSLSQTAGAFGSARAQTIGTARLEPATIASDSRNTVRYRGGRKSWQ